MFTNSPFSDDSKGSPGWHSKYFLGLNSWVSGFSLFSKGNSLWLFFLTLSTLNIYRDDESSVPKTSSLLMSWENILTYAKHWVMQADMTFKETMGKAKGERDGIQPHLKKETCFNCKTLISYSMGLLGWCLTFISSPLQPPRQYIFFGKYNSEKLEKIVLLLVMWDWVLHLDTLVTFINRVRLNRIIARM